VIGGASHGGTIGRRSAAAAPPRAASRPEPSRIVSAGSDGAIGRRASSGPPGRRLAFFAAAALAAAAAFLPLWGFRMSAPQYPGESLHLTVTARAIGGDVHEITTLQKYIGVRFPTRLPELHYLVPAILSLAAAFLVAGLLAGRRRGRYVAWGAFALSVLFFAASAAVLQKRLYDVGHDRDPHAPLRSMHDFTPPLVGPAKIGNFTVWSYPHAGAGLLIAAAGAVAWGLRARRERGPRSLDGARG